MELIKKNDSIRQEPKRTSEVRSVEDGQNKLLKLPRWMLRCYGARNFHENGLAIGWLVQYNEAPSEVNTMLDGSADPR